MSRMIQLNRFFLLCICIFYSILLEGQNAYLEKKVNLPGGQVMLKAVLKSISTQTGCIFSYDPTRIVDKQLVTVSSKGSISLHAALSEILPKNVLFKMNGKYIVLQAVERKAAVNEKTPAIIQPKQNKPAIQIKKGRGTIDKNLALERLVLPPIEPAVEILPVSTVVDTVLVLPVDSVRLVQNVIPEQKADSTLTLPITTDSVPVSRQVATELPGIDTIKVTTIESGNFISKKGFLELALSLNKQLGSLSIRPGLYDVYAILSIGSDYNRSYLLGFGAGIHIRIDNHYSLNFDLLRNAIIAGKSYLLQVRASNTQILPMLNYSLGNVFKVFAGPTVNLINSSYINSVSTTNLGAIVGVGFSMGIKVDLKSLWSKQI